MMVRSLGRAGDGVQKLDLTLSRRKLGELSSALEDVGRMFVLTHDHPDPDSMASVLGLSALLSGLWGVESSMLSGGMIGRADNRAMVRMLQIPLRAIDQEEIRPHVPFILVDTQPGFGNPSLPDDATCIGVVDHHPCESMSLPRVPFVDIRPAYGAVASIATEYLLASGVEIEESLATALCYGITSETQNLGRDAADADIGAYLNVFPLRDKRLLGRLHHPRLPPSFFAVIARAVQ